MEKLLQDLRFAIRSLFRQPAFALTAIVTLALGIGATTAIFSVVNAVVMRPLPFPHRIASSASRICGPRPACRRRSRRRTSTTGRRRAELPGDGLLRRRADERHGQRAAPTMPLPTSSGPDFCRPAARGRVGPSADGGGAEAGRTAGGGDHRCVLAAAVRPQNPARRFDDQVLRADVHDRGRARPGHPLPGARRHLWPAWIRPETTSRSAHNYTVIGRLADGVSVEQARRGDAGIAARLEQQYPASNTGKLVTVTGCRSGWSARRANAVTCCSARSRRAADRVRQRREPAARARDLARARDGRARRGRRLPRPPRPSAAHRERAARARWPGCWASGWRASACSASSRSRRRSCRASARCGWTPPRSPSRCCGAGHELAVRSGARVAVLARRADEGMRQGGKGSSIGARSGWARNVLRRRGGGARGRAGRRRRPARALPGGADAVDMGFDAERLLVLRTPVPVRTLEEAPRATAFYRERWRTCARCRASIRSPR